MKLYVTIYNYIKPGNQPSKQPKQPNLGIVSSYDAMHSEIYENQSKKFTNLTKSTQDKANTIPYMKVGSEKES